MRFRRGRRQEPVTPPEFPGDAPTVYVVALTDGGRAVEGRLCRTVAGDPVLLVEGSLAAADVALLLLPRAVDALPAVITFDRLPSLNRGDLLVIDNLRPPETAAAWREFVRSLRTVQVDEAAHG